MTDKVFKTGDIVRITHLSGEHPYTRNIVIYEHKPQKYFEEEWMWQIIWNNSFYKYLDLDTGEVMVGNIPYESNDYATIEKL